MRQFFWRNGPHQPRKVGAGTAMCVCCCVFFGLRSMVFLGYVGLRKALSAVIRMLAGQVGPCRGRSR
jgi:hypothetical protein